MLPVLGVSIGLHYFSFHSFFGSVRFLLCFRSFLDGSVVMLQIFAIFSVVMPAESSLAING